jgi:hypothetical protein
MVHYAFALIYGLLLLASFVGWGSIVAWWSDRGQAGLSLRAAWGMALCIAAGGWLNLFGISTRPTLIALVALGILILAIARPRIPAAASSSLLLCVIVLLGLRCAAAVSSNSYNSQDDYQGYFVFPQKIIQTGGLGSDPFSERRIISSLGGQYFLDSMLISGVDEAHIDLLDRGIGLLVLAGLVWSMARELGMARNLAACALLPIALVFSPQANVSSLLIACAMCVALYQTLEMAGRKPNSIVRDGLLVGLLAAGTSTLKMNVIPGVGLLALFYFLGKWLTDRRGRAATLAGAGVAGGATLLFLLPWMIASFRANGTFLYPLLGHGYYGSRFGDYRLPTAEMSLVSIYHWIGTALVGVVPIVILLSVVYSIARRQIGTSEFLLALAAVVANIVVAICAGGFATDRFTFSFNFAAILILLCHWLARPNGVFAAMLVIGLVIGETWHPLRVSLDDNAAWLVSEIKGHTAGDDWDRGEYQAMQQSVPAGQTILARLDDPFLLNFRRNPINIIDMPGRASPPPGMPSFAGSEPLADYLLGQHIRYIAYSYGDEAGYSRAVMGDRLNLDKRDWTYNTATYVFDFQDNLRELGRTRRRVYDDGRIWVIDLSRQVGTADERR